MLGLWESLPGESKRLTVLLSVVLVKTRSLTSKIRIAFYNEPTQILIHKMLNLVNMAEILRFIQLVPKLILCF